MTVEDALDCFFFPLVIQLDYNCRIILVVLVTSPLGIATLGATRDIVPIAFPFLAPRKGASANDANFAGQVLLFDRFALFVIIVVVATASPKNRVVVLVRGARHKPVQRT